jgi:hypothetical protein
MLSVAHRLSSVVTQIDDGKASVAEANIAINPQTTTVRTAMGDEIRKLSDLVRIDRSSLANKAEYSAHASACLNRCSPMAPPMLLLKARLERNSGPRRIDPDF